MTAPPTCLHCALWDLIEQRHPDKQVTGETISQILTVIAQILTVIAQIIATEPDRNLRRAFLNKMARDMPVSVQHHRAQLERGADKTVH